MNKNLSLILSTAIATGLLIPQIAKADTQLILRNNSAESIDIAVMYNRNLKLRGFSFPPNSSHLKGFERIEPNQSKVIINEGAKGECLDRGVSNIWLSVFQVNSNQEWAGGSGRGNKFNLQPNMISSGSVTTPIGMLNLNQISPSVVSELRSGTSLLFNKTPFSVNGCNSVIEVNFPW